MAKTLARLSRAVVGALDVLPAWARHLAIVFAGAFIVDLFDQVRRGNLNTAGVAHAVAAGAAAAVAVVGALAVTPLTTQYGAGAGGDGGGA